MLRICVLAECGWMWLDVAGCSWMVEHLSMLQLYQAFCLIPSLGEGAPKMVLAPPQIHYRHLGRRWEKNHVYLQPGPVISIWGGGGRKPCVPAACSESYFSIKAYRLEFYNVSRRSSPPTPSSAMALSHV